MKFLRTKPANLKFVNEVHSYWRSNQIRHYENAANYVYDVFYPLSKLGEAANSKAHVEIFIAGWASPWRLRGLSLKGLRASNPKFKIRLRRWGKRTDVSNTHGIRYIFSGFSIVGTGPIDIPFALPDGIASFSKVIPDDGIAINNEGEDTLFLYIEIASHEIIPDVDSLILAIVLHSPFELTEILSSSGFYEVAEWLAITFKRTKVMANWVSRWRYLSLLEESSFDSEWRIVPIAYSYGGLFPKRNESEGRLAPFPKMVLDGGVAFPSYSNISIISYPKIFTELTEATIQNGGLTVSNGAVFWNDLCGDPRLSRGNEVIIDVFGSPTRGSHSFIKQDPPVGVGLEEAIFVGGRHDFNWFHWIAEYLPSIVYIEDQVDKDIPILISAHVPKQGVEALHLLTKRSVHVIPKGKSIRLKKLYKHSPSFGVPDNYIQPWTEACFADFQALTLFANKVIENTGSQRVSNSSIFLARNSKHRSLTNEKKLAKIASEEFGFDYVSAERLSFLEQVNLFNGAEKIVGAGGAHMANFMFANPDCRIASMTSMHDYDSPVPALMAQVSGAEFLQIVGRPAISLESCRSLHQAKHSDFEIDEKNFRQVLRNQLG